MRLGGGGPTTLRQHADNCTLSFEPKSGVKASAVLPATRESSLAERDWAAYRYFSGDIGAAGDSTDNSFM